MQPTINHVSAGGFLSAQAPEAPRRFNRTGLLKKGIWLYFLLLLFEGALRKWVLPGFATPLLVVRDPLAIWLLLAARQQSLLPYNANMKALVLIGILSLFTGYYLGHGNFMVALFGARVFLLHFPLIFVIGRVFTREDVIKMGKGTLWIAIPMTFLIALQFNSPQSAWVNRGIGGDIKGGGFQGALGYMRPPGTFSFTTGVSQFFSFAAAFVFYFWFQGRGVNKLLLIAATCCLMAAIPLSISRGLFFSIGVSLVFGILAIIRKPKYLGRVILAGMAVFFLFSYLGNSGLFQNATKVFTARFDMASRSEGGLEGALLDRYFGGMVGALQNSSEQPYWGFGSGMGTNVGAMLMSGKQVFLIAEGEWGRLVGELGPLLGILVIFFRLRFCTQLSYSSYLHLKSGNLLPWMLLSFALLNIPQAQWAQPTSLGFSIVIGGLVLAALNGYNKN